jgi:hypothetical protein
MIIKRLNRTDPERVFVVALCNEAQAADTAVAMEAATASIDGVKVRQPDTGMLYAFVGLNDASIASGSYGLVQVYGYRSTSVVFQTNTSISEGVPLVPVAGQAYLQSAVSTLASDAAITLQPYFAALLETIVSSAASATVSKKIFLRAM